MLDVGLSIAETFVVSLATIFILDWLANRGERRRFRRSLLLAIAIGLTLPKVAQLFGQTQSKGVALLSMGSVALCILIEQAFQQCIRSRRGVSDGEPDEDDYTS